MNERSTRGWNQSRLELVGSGLLVLAGARYLMLFMFRGANLLDEGSTAAMANRILHGEVIYRDFMTVATPGSFYTVAWLFQLFGADLMVMRWAVMAIALGILVATLIAARHIMSWPFAAASALLTVVWGWFLVAPNLYSWQAMFFALVALVSYLRFTRTERSLWIWLAGVACGLAIAVKQNTGLYAMTGLLLAEWLSMPFEPGGRRRGWRDRWRATRRLGSGIALVVLPMLIYLTMIGAAPHLYENWVYYPVELYRQGLALPYPQLYPLLPAPGLETISQALPALLTERVSQPAGYEAWQKLVLYLPVLVYPFALVALTMLAIQVARRGDFDRAREGRALLAVTIFGAATFLQAWPRADATHILFGIQPAFVLLGYLCFCGWRITGLGFDGTLARRLLAGALLAFALLPHAALLRNGYKFTEFGYQNEYKPIETERGRGIRTSVRAAAEIDLLTGYITSHTAPGEPIFVVPLAAGLYFLTDRPNPTRFDVLLYGDADVYPCLIATLDARQPRYVIYGYAWDVDGRRFSEYARPIDEYVRSQYQIAERFDEYEVWRRREDARPVYGEGPGACKRRTFDARELRKWLSRIGVSVQ